MGENFKYDIAKGFQRTNDFPLDKSSVFTSLAAARDYAEKRGPLGKTSYLGQVLAVVENNEIHIYKIGLNKDTNARELQELGGIIDRRIVIGNVTIEPGTPIADVLEMLNDIIITTEPIVIDGDVIVSSGTTFNDALILVVDKLVEKINESGIDEDEFRNLLKQTISGADEDVSVIEDGNKLLIKVNGISNDDVIVLDRERTITLNFGNGIPSMTGVTLFDDIMFANIPDTVPSGGVWKIDANLDGIVVLPNELFEPGDTVTITGLTNIDGDSVDLTAVSYFTNN